MNINDKETAAGATAEKVCCSCKEEPGTLMLDDDNGICENCAQIQSELAP